MADLSAASAAHQAAVGEGTHENDTLLWNRYVKYCNSIGLGGNYFLDRMHRQHQIEIVGAFAMAVRQGQFLRQGDGPLAKSTVSNTINAVAAAFKDNGQEDPHKDAERNVSRLLQWQLRSYKKDDPKEKQQKALPVCILRLILSSKSTKLQHAMGELVAAAHFWAMWSCEYCKVPKAEQQQTKQLCLWNIVFIKGGIILDHSSFELNLADCVSITFEQQKIDRKSDTVTQWRTADPIMCPIKLWASIIT
jgi:hypothetical protein